MFRFSRIRAAIPAALLAAAACGDDPVQPLDPTEVNQHLATVSAALSSPQMQDLVSLSALFNVSLPPATSAATQALALVYASGDATASGVASQREALRSLLATRPAFGASGAAAVLPAEVLGVTFVYNPATGSYEASAEPGATSDVVRFLLYAVDPFSGLPVEPLTPTGHVDLRELSTSTSDVIGITAVSSGTTFADYQVSASATETSETIGVNGFVLSPDGTRVDVAFTATGTATTQTLNSTLSIDSEGFRVSTDLGFTLNPDQSETATVSILVQAPGGSMQIAGTIVDDGGALAVTVGGQPFATITLAPEAEPTIEAAGGGSVSPEDVETISAVFGLGFFSLLFVLLVFVAPVGFLFGGV
jgi:hypothetical protein